jgi:cysteinyl-tRNA synthetase
MAKSIKAGRAFEEIESLSELNERMTSSLRSLEAQKEEAIRRLENSSKSIRDAMIQDFDSRQRKVQAVFDMMRRIEVDTLQILTEPIKRVFDTSSKVQAEVASIHPDPNNLADGKRESSFYVHDGNWLTHELPADTFWKVAKQSTSCLML